MDEPAQLPPLYTILVEDRMPTGAVRVLARVRGGRMIRLYVPPADANGPTIDGLLVAVIELAHADRFQQRRGSDDG